MVGFVSLSSGSNGNCYFIECGGKALLIDVGIGNRTIKKRLSELDFSIESIIAVLVTHDHFDHIKSLGTFTDRWKKPVYATKTLHNAFRRNFCTRGLLLGCERILEPDASVEIGPFNVTPFIVPHDATQTLGYLIKAEDTSIAVMTDVGNLTPETVHYASLASNLVIESNYDLDMLMQGSYPPELKDRIITGCGHLSNEQTSSLLRQAYSGIWKNVFLCHLSANNNTPQIAYDAAKETLRSLGCEASLHCLPRSSASEVFYL